MEQDERAAFAATPHQWPAYADSHTGLTVLQARAKVGALSNIDNASLTSSCRHLDFRFDVVVTAERVGAYKPDWPGCRASAIRVTVPGKVRSGISGTCTTASTPGANPKAWSWGTLTWVRITLLCMMVNMNVPLVASACTSAPTSILRWVMTPSNGATTR